MPNHNYATRFKSWFKHPKHKKGAAREFLAKLSNGIMMPIAVLPIAGLLLGIGSAIQNAIPSSLEAFGGTETAYVTLKGFAAFITNSGNFVFGNLAVLFAIAIAIAFTRDSGVAGLACFIAWISFNGMQNAMIFPAASTSVTYALNVGALGTTTTQENLFNAFKAFDPQKFNMVYGTDNFPAQFEAAFKSISTDTWNSIQAAFNDPTSGGLHGNAVTIMGTGSATPNANPNFDILYWKNLDASIFTANTGINSLQTSVFGGAIIGAIVALLYNKFYQIQLPKILGFFSGTRFVPIISLLAMMPVAVLFAIIWPGIGLLLNIIGVGLGTLSANGGVNALIFGYIERALVPFGLHHAFYSPLWFTSVGGSMANAGTAVPFIRIGDNVYAIVGAAGTSLDVNHATWQDVIQSLNSGYNFSGDTDSWNGDQRLWFAINRYLAGKEVLLSNGDYYKITFQTFAENTLNKQLPAVSLSDPTAASNLWSQLKTDNNSVLYSSQNFIPAFKGVNPGQYEQGKYPFMIFGLPAAAAAMVMAAPKENRKVAGSIVASAGLTAFLTGITEPMEFSFLFLAPWLYWGIHASLCAISFWLMSLLGANVGQTFSGGIIDLGIYGFLPDGLGLSVNSYWAVVLGVVYAPMYFVIFYFLIKRFDLKTPGRGGTLKSKKEYLAMKDARGQKGAFTQTQLTAFNLINAFGGASNISAVNACITKLRVNVRDPKKVDETLVNELGSQGIMKPSPTLLHAIFGTDSEPIKTQMNNILENQLDVKALEKVATAQEAQILGITANEPVSVSEKVDEIVILAPVSGTIKPLSDVNDKVFSDKIMGDGIAILPDNGKFVVPFAKPVKVDVAFPTGHAYVVDADGAKIMIHIGLETVNLNTGVSDPSKLIAFKPHVKTGDAISDKDTLVDVDFNVIKEKHLETITPVIVMGDSLKVYDVSVIPTLGSHVNVKDPLLKLTLKKN